MHHLPLRAASISTSKKLNRFADPETPIKPPAFEPLHSTIASKLTYRQQHHRSRQQDQQQLAKSGRERSMMAAKKGGGVAPAVAVALVVVAAVAVTTARADVSCADVDANLRPCVGYVTGKEAAPAAECCAGVRRIRAMPSGTAERRQACQCVKQAAAGYQPLNADAIRDLPAQCGTPLPFPLTLNFDCTTIP